MAIADAVREENRFNRTMITWTLAAAGDTGAPVDVSEFADKFFQLYGTISGTTCVLQGSTDPRVITSPGSAKWVTLSYAKDGTAISGTAEGGGQVLDNPRWVRPSTTGGAGTGITFTLECVKGFKDVR